MANCPYCGNYLAEDAKFCNTCGASLAAAPSQEAVQSEDVALFLQGESAAEQPDFVMPGQGTDDSQQKAEGKPRKKFRKGWIFAGVGVLLAVAAVLVYFFVFKKDKLPSFALYVKDDQLVYSKFTDKTTFELTDKLLTDDLELEDLMDDYRNGVVQTDQDGKRIFFPDRFSEENLDEDGDVESFNLYYRDVKKAGSEPVKVDSDVEDYIINYTGTKVLYKKEGNLYIHDLEDKEKIDNDVWSYYHSPDLSKVIYTIKEEEESYDKTLYYWEEGQDEPQRLTDEIHYVEYITEDFSTVYYTKSNGSESDSSENLYKFDIKNDKSEKIASDIYVVCAIYDSGEIYYTQEKELVSDPMSDWVIDEKKDSDAKMTQPEYPYYSDYSTYSAYEAAKEYYDDVLWPAWEEKLARDSLREQIARETLTISAYTLCYYDGEDSKEIADLKYGYDYAQAWDAQVMAVIVLNEVNLQQVKLSEIESVWDVRSKVMDADVGSVALVIGNKLVDLKHEDATDISFVKDGSLVYYTTDYSEEEDTYDLYKASISGDKLGKAERVDSNVEGYTVLLNGSVLYTKDVVQTKEETEDGGTRTSATFDLYMDGEKIDSDVVGARPQKDGTVLYMTDMDADEECGTLKCYKKGKKTKIADDVYTYNALPNGDILYLTDYDLEDMEGELYRYSGKKSKKLDDEVSMILQPMIVTADPDDDYYY